MLVGVQSVFLHGHHVVRVPATSLGRHVAFRQGGASGGDWYILQPDGTLYNHMGLFTTGFICTQAQMGHFTTSCLKLKEHERDPFPEPNASSIVLRIVFLQYIGCKMFHLGAV